MSQIYSPSRSPASSRLPLGGGVSGVSRFRSSSLKKPPEPLRRAVADCLSSSSSSSAPAHHGIPSATASEASRTLREYLAAYPTTDLAYGVILDHTLAERERSPAVVAKCVALLKRYLLRYKPSEETLVQIDRFCVSIIAECDMSPNRKLAPWSRSLSQQSGASTTSNTVSPLPVSSYASGALVKSFNYVRSLIAQYIPKRSFQSAAFAGAPTVSRQALPTLSSLLSKSFNSQLSPANGKELLENKDVSTVATSGSPIAEEINRMEDHEFTAFDVFKWRWCRDQQSSPSLSKSDHLLNPKDVSAHDFLEVGAAALLVGDMEAKMKGEPWKIFGSTEMPYLDQLLQPSLLTTVTNSASARAHLRAITALKRSKPGPHQIWEDSPVSTFRPRAKPLFQYRHYSLSNGIIADVEILTRQKISKPGDLVIEILNAHKVNIVYRYAFIISHYLNSSLVVSLNSLYFDVISEQQPLRLNPMEVYEVIAAACSETSAPNTYLMTVSSKLSNNSGKPSMDVAISVLVKLIIDMYVLDSETAAPLALSMLEEMMSSTRLESKTRAFDLILNVGVHAHLMEPPTTDDASTIEEEYCKETFLDNETHLSLEGNKKSDYLKKAGNSSAINKFECWILGILYEILLHLVQTEEKEESIWASALSCLLYFVCDRGRIRSSRLKGLDIRVVQVLICVSRMNSWAEIVHSKLIDMLTNMFYEIPEISNKGLSATPEFLIQQVDLIGGIEFIFVELVLSNSREERRNLYLVLFDYALHQINESCIASGTSDYSDDEVQPVAMLLLLADAPEALHISVKLGLDRILELLQRPISSALSKYPNSDRLSMLLGKIVENFEMLIKSFTHLDKEFAHMKQITKSCKSLESINGAYGNSFGMKVKLSWATLHSLLHSERTLCRHNGYLWLGDLIITEIVEEGDASIWSSVRILQENIARASVIDYSPDLDVPLSIWLMCGLIKSKNNLIRWGFLYVLERLLMRCKFLLDESEVQHTISGETVGDLHDKSRLEKANAVIDIMSSALSLMAQINETDRMNILKMCEVLFSQLCLKVLPSTLTSMDDPMTCIKDVSWNKKLGRGESFPRRESSGWEEHIEDTNHKLKRNKGPPKPETSSIAALLLHGQAIVPMQLVARVPAALFYWPLIQLAGAATDKIALGVSVGSKGRGNVPGSTSDIRATLLLLLIGKCTADPAAFKEVGGEEFFRELLDDTDSRVAYYSSMFLLKAKEPENYQRMLHNLVSRAQQSLIMAYSGSIIGFDDICSVVASTGNSKNCLELLVLDVTWTALFLVAGICRVGIVITDSHLGLWCSLQSNNEKLLENPYLQMRGGKCSKLRAQRGCHHEMVLLSWSSSEVQSWKFVSIYFIGILFMDERSSDDIFKLLVHQMSKASGICPELSGTWKRIYFDLIVGVSDWVTAQSSGLLLPVGAGSNEVQHQKKFCTGENIQLASIFLPYFGMVLYGVYRFILVFHAPWMTNFRGLYLDPARRRITSLDGFQVYNV
ncbi:hypothetical protein RND71_015179 [Anisodus tanguticus]|uniref:Uncharacterized protein n=1 Tax=Anisodus tanguticus TaxID=243964 RepID=A0AAE1VNF8_9SOLA|nr:hypothetical protein RND71_015179 [Anisodus tanguticus]